MNNDPEFRKEYMDGESPSGVAGQPHVSFRNVPRKERRFDPSPTFIRGSLDACEAVNTPPAAEFCAPNLELSAAGLHNPSCQHCTLLQINEALERQAAHIADSLHDDASQLLTVAYLKLERARQEVSPECAVYLNEIHDLFDKIEHQLRRLAHELHPAILKDFGLMNALEFLIQGVAERAGLNVRLEGPIGLAVPASIETALYRFTQEALTNIVRHARARNVVIQLAQSGEAITCMATDDGAGFDTTNYSPGLGIRGMRQRVQAVGGNLSLSSIPGVGTEIVVTIPLRRTFYD
jgi:signal transduction histidine kinase